jgi:hypothetical protein
MKKVLLPLSILAVGALALAGVRDWMAVGRGLMHGHPGHTELAFDFGVYQTEGKTWGSLLLWGESGHPYPDIVIRADTIAQAKFVGTTARFLGLGRYHDVPAVIIVTASDNSAFQRPDTLGVLVLDLLGRPIVYTTGEVEQGNIYVGPRD